MPNWLTLDLGNSAIKGGLFDGDRLVRTFRLAAWAGNTEWRRKLATELEASGLSRVGLASVTPALTEHVGRLAGDALGRPPLVVRPDLRLPFQLAYETPSTLGSDRLAAAVAAWTVYRQPGRAIIAVDAGTAVTYEVVDEKATYLGGAIAAGPELAGRALAEGTAQLPDVRLEHPVSVVGRSTRAAIQSGVMHGFIDGVAGMLARLGGELDTPPTVVATGGWSAMLAEHVAAIDHADPHLVLRGIRALMTLNDPAANDVPPTAVRGT